MKYERFKELFDALIKNNPNIPIITSSTYKMKEETEKALIDYSKGDKKAIELVKEFLA